MPDQDKDQAVRENPGEFTVEEVVEVLSRSTPAQVKRAQEAEKRGKDRKAIAQHGLDEGDPSERGGGQYERDRLIAEGQDFLGVPHYVVAGALHDAPRTLTVADARKRVRHFLGD